MKISSKLVTYLLVSTIAILNVHAEESFETLNLKREGRKEILDTAIAKRLVFENETGLLSKRNKVSPLADILVDVENETRQKQFALISSSSGKSTEEVGRDFAKRSGYSARNSAETVLRIHGSNTIGASLMPSLVQDFLEKKLGVADVSVSQNGVETTLVYPESKGSSAFSAIEVVAHGSSTAFGETEENREVGIEGGFCDIGMASRPIKDAEADAIIKEGMSDLRENSNVFPIAVDGVAIIVHPSNSVTSLSVSQIASLFSGEIKNWRELDGSDLPVEVFERDSQSGTYETFVSKVLSPNSKTLLDPSKGKFERNSQVVDSVVASRGGIGFIGLGALNSSVRALSVKAANDTRAFIPNRLTLKSLDYPLSRLLYLYSPAKRSKLTSELLEYVMSNSGQSRVDQEGLVGQGLATTIDREQAADFKEELVADSKIPEMYRNAIEKADREDSGFNIRFSTGDKSPDSNSANNLKRLVDLLANPEMEKVSVVLIGFADSVGRKENNLRLSRERANNIANYLRQNGVERVEAIGIGDQMPVGDNTNSEGRAANRRVEVWLKRS